MEIWGKTFEPGIRTGFAVVKYSDTTPCFRYLMLEKLVTTRMLNTELSIIIIIIIMMLR